MKDYKAEIEKEIEEADDIDCKECRFDEDCHKIKYDEKTDCSYGYLICRADELLSANKVLRIMNKASFKVNSDLNKKLIKARQDIDKICKWKLSEPDICAWETECGEMQLFTGGDPKENRHNYCPYCGGKIKVL